MIHIATLSGYARDGLTAFGFTKDGALLALHAAYYREEHRYNAMPGNEHRETRIWDDAVEHFGMTQYEVEADKAYIMAVDGNEDIKV